MHAIKRWAMLSLLGMSLSSAMAADFVPEQASVAKLPLANSYRLFLSDVAISHIIDGRLHIVDGETLKYTGMVGTGFTGLTTLSPDRSEIYVATTYLAKLNRGTRTDQIDVYDSQTLQVKAEIALPPKRAQALPYKHVISTSPDGHFIFVQNATPASSVAVVDRKAAKFLAEIPTPGCWSILPAQSANNRFTTVCGDGTLLTLTLNPDGTPSSQQRSERLFDPDKEPIYTQAENDGDTYYFLSYYGDIRTANLGGEVARVGEHWSFINAEDQKKNWRPGGYQPFALDHKAQRLYVSMHPDGKEGSHKDPGAEIWTLDLKSHTRTARVEGNHAVALAVSRGEHPRLFVIDPLSAGVVSYETSPTLSPLKRVDGFGEAPILIETY